MNDTASSPLPVLDAIFVHASIGIAFVKNRVLVRCNPAIEQALGYGSGEMNGLATERLFSSHASYALFAMQARPHFVKGKSYIGSAVLCGKDGQAVLCNLRASALISTRTEEGSVWLFDDVTAIERSAREFAHTSAMLQAVMDNAPVGIIFTRERRITRYNGQFLAMFRFGVSDPAGHPARELFASDADYDELGRIVVPELSMGQPCKVEMQMQRQDGEVFWAQMIAYVISPEDTSQGTIWVIDDTSARHAAQAELLAAKALTDAVFNSANVSIIATDLNGTITLINDTALQWLNYTREALVGRATPQVLHKASEVVDYAVQLSEELGMAVAPGFDVFVIKAVRDGSDAREWTYIRKDGSTFAVHLSVSPMRSSQGVVTGYIGVGIDVTYRQRADAEIRTANEQLELRVHQRTVELANTNALLRIEIEQRTKIENEMRHMAHFDALTGLPNRNLLNDRIDQALEMGRRRQTGVGILFIDLDHFKDINDSLGHHVGDLLLTQVARRMSQMLRAADTLGRLGGDEFLLLAPDVEEPDRLERLAFKLVDALERPFEIDSHVLHVTPSVGICCFPEHGADRATLMRNADTAMYFAKSSGRNTYKFFAEVLNAEVDRKFHIANALRFAMLNHEFSLDYQPLVDDDGGSIVGVEALLRWDSALLGPMAPLQFISIAEESGLIISIGNWVLREACRQARQWQQSMQPSLVLAVNLSAHQFNQADLAATVRAILEETQFPAACLSLEFTESSLMHDVDRVIATLQELAALGVRLAIDDFGVGYSSLSSLQLFPVHTLKIDRSFVRDLGADNRAAGIVGTVIALARTLNLEVIAEGVETAAQQVQLRALGCQHMQGFRFSHPVPAAQVEALLARGVLSGDDSWQA